MTPGEIHGLHARIVADLKRELAEAKAEANKVTESMGSEIVRLHGEIEQQRTRAEAAEQELREQHAAYIAPMSDKLAAIRAHLAGVDVAALAEAEKSATAGPWIEGPLYWILRYAGKLDLDIYKHLDGEDLTDEETCRIPRKEDAAFIASIRAAVPALLAAAREALEP